MPLTPAAALLLSLWAQAPAPAVAAAPELRPLVGHLRVLAAPAMQGRGMRTAGLPRAMNYIAGQFQRAGLVGGAPDGGYLDCLEVQGPVAPGSRLALGDQALAPDRDFVAAINSPLGTGGGPVVWAGYGIQGPAGSGYDDYAGLDVRDKVVLILRHAPAVADRSLRAELRARMGLVSKLDTAARRGARAVLFVSGPASRGAPLSPLRVPAVGPARPVAVFHLSRPVADRLLAPAGISLTAAEHAIRTSGRPASRPLAAQAAYQVRGVSSCNVLGTLQGSDPSLRPQLLVLGAHYDHLGLGDEGNSAQDSPGRHAVHPGADDNASGVAALLEIARALAHAPTAPRRTILFAAFTGEEKGLWGSQHLVARLHGQPPLAMLNLDMIGRLRNHTLEVEGAPTAAPLRGIAEAANTERLRLVFLQAPSLNSDHASFIERQIPALSLSTGLHADYHRPSDTAARINGPGLLRATRLAMQLGRRLADWPRPLVFTPPPPPPTGPSGGVRLGIVPDLEAAGQVRVASVLPGTPAAAAGLRPGDVLRDLGGHALADLGSYGDVLARFQVGQRVPIVVERDGARRAGEVVFTAPLPFDPP